MRKSSTNTVLNCVDLHVFGMENKVEVSFFQSLSCKTMSDESQTQSIPSRIQRLSEEVINKIAAGEVIQRPSNALKELLENSLDAKSTQIKLYLRDGGITELRIEDNGNGILKDDFPLLCERFATSKLEKFEDLYSIATYGFRGEALASISFCAQLTITSKTKNESCAYRAHFINGKMYDPDNPSKDYKQIEPSIVAGMPGTQIIVKKLFYNMTVRQKALKSRLSQEYNSCLRVVSCYAIHNYHCSFAVQKLNNSGANSLDLNIRTSPNKKSKDVIKAIYGGNIAQYLIEIEREHPKIRGLKINGVISNCDFAMNVSGNVSNKNRNKSKKRIFNTNNKMELVLFINHRLVESNMIKRCIMSVYEDYLAKHHYPFVYLSIVIPPNFVDVNVHPTKKEVKFLHEDQVLQLIQDAIDDKLKVENNSRTFHAHSLQHFMTQSKVKNVVSITSPNRQKTKRDELLKKKNNENNDNVNNKENENIAMKKKENKGKVIKCNTNNVDEIVVIKDETDVESTRQQLIASLSQSVEFIQRNQDASNQDASNQDEDEDEDGINDDNNNSVSPNAPLKRRGKATRPHISNVNRVSLENSNNNNNKNGNISLNDGNDNVINDRMLIDDDEDDDNHDMLNNFNFSPSPQSKKSNRNQNKRRSSLRRSSINRKRNYSNMIDTDDDEEQARNDAINVNDIQFSLIYINQ